MQVQGVDFYQPLLLSGFVQICLLATDANKDKLINSESVWILHGEMFMFFLSEDILVWLPFISAAFIFLCPDLSKLNTTVLACIGELTALATNGTCVQYLISLQMVWAVVESNYVLKYCTQLQIWGTCTSLGYFILHLNRKNCTFYFTIFIW